MQKKLGCPRASLGSLSEAVEVFDPEPVKQIASELAAQLEPLGHDRQFPDVKHLVTAVDGTVVKTLARIVQAAYLRSPTDGRSLSAWRLHTHFDVERGLPVRIDVTGAGNRGENDERAVLAEHAAGRPLLRAWIAATPSSPCSMPSSAAGSSYVCRVRDNSVYEVVEQRPLSAEAAAADVDVRCGGADGPGPHRGGAARPSDAADLHPDNAAPETRQAPAAAPGPRSDGVLRIATNLLDVPAEVIGFLYQRRWTIEIFFRFLKHILGCRHLLSTNPAGVEIQAYCAIIACLLIALWTGKQPTKRDLRDDLLLLHRLGRRGGIAGPFGEVETSRRLNRHRARLIGRCAAFAAARPSHLSAGHNPGQSIPRLIRSSLAIHPGSRNPAWR